MWYQSGILFMKKNTKIQNLEAAKMSSVNFLSFRELRTSTGKLEELLANDSKIIVTGNGKPKALMIQINEMNFEDTIARVNLVKLEQARREKKINLAATVKKILAEAALSESDGALSDADWDEMANLRSQTNLHREVKI